MANVPSRWSEPKPEFERGGQAICLLGSVKPDLSCLFFYIYGQRTVHTSPTDLTGASYEETTPHLASLPGSTRSVHG